MKVALRSLAFLVLGCGGSEDPAAGGDGPIAINEVTSLGDAKDALELYNRSSGTVDLSDWYIQDEDRGANDKTYAIPSGTTLAPGAYLKLEKGTHHAFGFGNTDAVFLFDTDGNLSDSTNWLDEQASLSWCRLPDGTGAFTSCSQATFGAANVQ